MLLDEPFSALDAELREELRTEIRVIQRKLGISVVMVTHDQNEAFTVSDVVGVMNNGKMEQVGTPDDLIRVNRLPVLSRSLWAREITSAVFIERWPLRGGYEQFSEPFLFVDKFIPLH